MTPKQRAIGVVAQIGRYSPSKEIQGLIEEAITAAIIEECEACVLIAETIRARELKRQPDGTFYDTIAEEIRDRIQMRPETSNSEWSELKGD